MAIDLERLKVSILKDPFYAIVFLKCVKETKTKVQLLLEFTDIQQVQLFSLGRGW